MPRTSYVLTVAIRPALDELEMATLKYTDWINHRRLQWLPGSRPPAEHRAIYDQHNLPVAPAGAQ